MNEHMETRRKKPQVHGYKPQKLYYTLNEASQLLRVKPHVLRYWDKEFRVRVRRKGKRNSSKYHREEIKVFLKIKNYLYNELYSIRGAKKKFEEEKQKRPVGKDGDYRGLLLRVRRGLKFIEARLN